ncbi:ABC transporter permease subunit [Ciceribacter naphthalenivorans]|uniref:ABC transporter permease subunit n=1 Tax=Ciceribacter naphthalenivorans TaxID=1118451 RepID=UPI001478656F|nr:ABC transporter permease subunit [Ciceribacter naphthalenivorans]
MRASFAEPAGGGVTLANWISVLGGRSARTAIGNSLALAVVVATIALIVGGPLAWSLARMARGWRALNLGLLTVANNFSGIGLAFGYVAALGSYGMITLGLKALGVGATPPAPTSFWGLVIAYEYGIVPMFVLLTLPAMSLIREEWWEACQCCGAGRLQFWRHVGLPMLAPFLGAGWLLCFTWAVGLYGLPVALLGSSRPTYPLITIDMSRTMMGSLFGSQRMPVLAAVLMILAVGSLWLYRWLLKRGTNWL